jgi:hypothetical protein
MNKPLKDWTLGEVSAYCENTACKDCALCTPRGPGISCDLTNDGPKDWDLTERPRFTEQEVEDAKVLMRTHSEWLQVVYRGKDGGLWLKAEDGKGFIPIATTMFPSIGNCKTVSLKEIAGESNGD